jgi:hypothetical protein
MMFDDMMKEYDMDIPKQDVEFIKALSAGDHARCRSVRNPVHAPQTQSHLINLQRREVFLIRDRFQQEEWY